MLRFERHTCPGVKWGQRCATLTTVVRQGAWKLFKIEVLATLKPLSNSILIGVWLLYNAWSPLSRDEQAELTKPFMR